MATQKQMESRNRVRSRASKVLGFTPTSDQLRLIVNEIQSVEMNENALFVGKRTNTRSVFRVRFNSGWVNVLYSREWKEIVDVLSDDEAAEEFGPDFAKTSRPVGQSGRRTKEDREWSEVFREEDTKC